ncbi:hypothetical protein [Kitasatospora sp. NPDC050543]|uniref:hypothetical protein n=1 Tax=Kitasatospora sp. NPDC050543 TaxID=3364054 RepID=UPI0037A0667E
MLTEPLLVISLRHPCNGTPRESTWLRLTAFLFNRGISDERTTGVEIHYDDPESTAPNRRRFDACLSVPPERLAGLSLLDARRDSLGIRVISLMGERPLLWRDCLPRPGAAQRPDGACARPYGVRHRRVQPAAGASPRANWPRYELYRGSPVLTPGHPEVLGWYATADQLTPGRHLARRTPPGGRHHPHDVNRPTTGRIQRP